MFQPDTKLTFTNAKSVLETGLHAIANGQTEIDLAHLTAVDSAAVATLLAWQRAGLEQGIALTFRNLPANLKSLIDLYGLEALLRH